MAKLINGDGNKAIWAQQDADLIASLAGNVTAIADVGSKFAATQEDANTIGLADGVIVTKEGRRIQLDVGNVDLFDIPTGTAGVTSYYIIGYHLYTESDSSQVCETFVQKMDNATDVITENTFRGGATEVYVSCYRVTQTGMNITSIDALLQNFKSLSEVMSALGDKTNKYSGTSGGVTYVTVDSIGYDSINKKLGLKVNGADTVIPFSSTMTTLTNYIRHYNNAVGSVTYDSNRMYINDTRSSSGGAVAIYYKGLYYANQPSIASISVSGNTLTFGGGSAVGDRYCFSFELH